MYSKTRTGTSTGSFWAALDRLQAALARAEAVVVGAGAGMSAAAGFDYGGARFRAHFADFEEKYGFHDMYTGGFYPYETAEERWAFWSRNILLNRYEAGVGRPYADLLRLLEDRDYFVLTTNVDHQFQKAGFDKTRLFYTQGDYGLFQCSGPCGRHTWDNEGQVRAMAAAERDMRVPSYLLPRCPVCGRPAAMNLRADDTFVQDRGWDAAAGRYRDFLARHRRGRVLYLELGVGYNTPAVIKYPFWQLTAREPQAVYACINAGEAWAPGALGDRAILADGDLASALSVLAGET